MKAYKKHKPKKEIFESRRKKHEGKIYFWEMEKDLFPHQVIKHPVNFIIFFVLLLRVGCVGERAQTEQNTKSIFPSFVLSFSGEYLLLWGLLILKLNFS